MSQNLRLIFTAILMLGLGILFDHFALEKFANSKTETLTPLKLSAEISPEEVRQYLQAQNADEKLKKADELLTKMIQIFVTDLGLRLTPKELQALQIKNIPQQKEKAQDSR